MLRTVLLCVALVVAALPTRADEVGEAVRSVIAEQLDAFLDGDLESAYTHASPMIQRKFPSPEIFGEMVRTGYPMIWRPARTEMLDLVETPRGPVQKVLVEDTAGRLYEAEYEMRLIEGEWRINGVYLRSVPGLGA